jgi:beta-N-acetylhexosaminidase
MICGRAVVDEEIRFSCGNRAIKAGADVVVVSRLTVDDQTSDIGAEINEAITAQCVPTRYPSAL